MTSSDLRAKYLRYFQKKGHFIIPSSSILPENDSTTLFTSSGMQPLIPYLLGQVHPEGKQLVNSQPCLRVQDIDEVGDNRHTTFFEMLGNWSLGTYFKESQIPFFISFLVDELQLPSTKLFATIFKGNKDIPQDKESEKILLSIFNEKFLKDFNIIGIKKITVNKNSSLGFIKSDRIFYYSDKKNWWSKSGSITEMPAGEIGGPDCEIFYDFGEEFHFHENSSFKDIPCHPNCDCGRFLEIGNSVFMEYQKTKKGFSSLPVRNVDFGGGLERLLSAVSNEPDIFKTDLFLPIIQSLENIFNIKYSDLKNQKSLRIIADHLKASIFLLNAGVVPSNKMQGYVLRRLLRRAAIKAYQLFPGFNPQHFEIVANVILKIYDQIYFDRSSAFAKIVNPICLEINKFFDSISKGLKQMEKIKNLNGQNAFDLYQTYGFPLEITLELAKEKNQTINLDEFRTEFQKHQQLSRHNAGGLFKSGLADNSEETTKLHTATHLLHQTLRTILGSHVRQKGSNINSKRLRFDFSHPNKLRDSELLSIEQLINQKIKENLPVNFSLKTIEEAQKEGALAFFTEKYGQKVKVYRIGNFSHEVCSGPHVSFTGSLKSFKIIKEEGAGAGIRRIYAIVG